MTLEEIIQILRKDFDIHLSITSLAVQPQQVQLTATPIHNGTGKRGTGASIQEAYLNMKWMDE